MRHSCVMHAGWRRPIGCFKLQVIFAKEPLIYKALLRKNSYEWRVCDIMCEWRIIYTYEWMTRRWCVWMMHVWCIIHTSFIHMLSHVSMICRLMYQWCLMYERLNDISCMNDASVIRDMDDAWFTTFLYVCMMIHLYEWMARRSYVWMTHEGHGTSLRNVTHTRWFVILDVIIHVISISCDWRIIHTRDVSHMDRYFAHLWSESSRCDVTRWSRWDMTHWSKCDVTHWSRSRLRILMNI